MSFWSKKSHATSSQQELSTSLEHINKLNELLNKLDSSIIINNSINHVPIDNHSNIVNIISANNSPIIAGTINYNNLILSTAINRDVNSEQIYDYVDEISKCLLGLKRIVLVNTSAQELATKTDSLSNRRDSVGKNKNDIITNDLGSSNINSTGGTSAGNLSLSKKHVNTNHNSTASSSMSGDSSMLPLSSASLNLDNIYDVFFKNDLLNRLLLKFPILDFESKKNISILFANGFGKCIDNKFVYVDYMSSKTDTINLLLIILENTTHTLSNSVEIYLVVGLILEECLKFEQLSRFVINLNSRSDIIWNLFDNCLLPSFEISTESFQIINLIFLKNPKMISNEFFNNKNNLNKFINSIDELLKHGNYVTKRQAVKLLSTMILGRNFNQLMTAYISDTNNLKVIMMLLNDKSKNLQLETFHIFKVFVANPNKNKNICDILIRNKQKLLKFFEINFNNLQEMNLKQEKDYIVHIIKDLPSNVSKLYSEENQSDASNSSLNEHHEESKEDIMKMN
ncbi:hypothetical protein QEN19_003470 [Hanseniaspora menglaensis]